MVQQLAIALSLVEGVPYLRKYIGTYREPKGLLLASRGLLPISKKDSYVTDSKKVPEPPKARPS
jgi:hypothetical protein